MGRFLFRKLDTEYGIHSKGNDGLRMDTRDSAIAQRVYKKLQFTGSSIGFAAARELCKTVGFELAAPDNADESRRCAATLGPPSTSPPPYISGYRLGCSNSDCCLAV